MAEIQGPGDCTSCRSNFLQESPKPVHLDGRTLEGGGQLVRNALALSALTGRAVIINHVRGNRGKTGLKGSHSEAVKLLAEISGSKVSGGEVGSQCLTFSPQVPKPVSTESTKRASLVSLFDQSVQSVYDIRLPTAGSVLLIFQALYPYLLHLGSQASVPCMRLNITGGTNVPHSPSYDYASQVIAPNLAQLGLPRLSIQLHKRGWSGGTAGLGTVSFLIHPLGSSEDLCAEAKDQESAEKEHIRDALRLESHCLFPRIQLMDHDRGKVSRIDITVLAPDSPLAGVSQDPENVKRQNGKSDHPKKGRRRHDGSSRRRREENTSATEPLSSGASEGLERPRTVRQYVEQVTYSMLRRELRTVDPSILHMQSVPLDGPTKGSDRDLPIPISIHTSEPTYHRSHLYVLIVGHTSTGFKIGHDALFGSHRGKHPSNARKEKSKGQNSSSFRHPQHNTDLCVATDLVDQCVQGFIQEISNQSSDTDPNQISGFTDGKRPCLDMHMRDQVVIFEALGKLCWDRAIDNAAGDSEDREDERDWTLHTKTAQWVCQRMLGDLEVDRIG